MSSCHGFMLVPSSRAIPVTKSTVDLRIRTPTFLSLQKDRYSIDFEIISALDRFESGLLTPSAQRPWAWNFEATVRPWIPWEIGFRLERSSGLPDSPETQFGVETTCSFGPHAAVSLEYLHGRFGNDYPDRDLFTAGFLLRW